MPYRKWYCAIITASLFALMIISCAKSESPEEQAKNRFASAPSQQAEMDQQPSAVSGEASNTDRRVMRGKMAAEKNAEEGGLGANFLVPMDMAKERLLEYTVNVSYECENILLSRKTLLDLVGKYGFIKRSSATTETREPYADVEIMVKADKLYDALMDFEALGILKSENITVVDHTETMVMNERRVQRENTRIIRRNKAMGQITAQGKNWQQVEQSIEGSEDKLDQAEQDKWQIRDRVSWASVHVTLRGPDQPNRVDVPLYRNAFIGLLNFFLRLVYMLIWLAPFVAIGIAVWVFRGRIAALFRRKK